MFCFFFQAEDGIRDYDVTGVQTCALPISRNFTNSKETIVLEGAYHGNLSSLIEISPYKHNGPGGSGTPDHVHVIPIPDPYRGKYKGAEWSEQYVQEVQNAIAEIQSTGKNVSARSEEHTSEPQSRRNLLCRRLLEIKNI